MKPLVFFLLTLATLGLAAGKSGKAKTDTQVKKAIIEESISSYPGNCPCPYNTARNGSLCGKRSAYNRAGGYSPLCFESDVTKEMMKEWRQSHGEGQ